MARYIINADIVRSKIDKNIYGNFSEHLGRCVYEGMYVGENSDIPNVNGMRTDVVEALKKIKLPQLRWPGGCFADTYHWMDGIGDKSKRKKIVNVHWGDVVEDNSFGTDEFMEFCRQVGCEPYICGNVGSGTVQEMQEWVEYLNSTGTPMSELRKENGHADPYGVTYFAVGNENWGCGGNMTPEFYADNYNRYAGYLHNYEKKLFKVACGPSGTDYNWTKVLMEKSGKRMDGLALHHYTVDPMHGWRDKGDAVDFNELEWASLLNEANRIDTIIARHSTIMDQYDPEKRVALVIDEWGTWFNVEKGTHPAFLYQQNTLRDALVAAMELNIFNLHSDRVRMCNIAQLINVLQALILTDGAKMILTPTYHIFDMYKAHMDANLVETYLECDDYEYQGIKTPAISQSASVNENGDMTITLTNIDPNAERSIVADIRGEVYASASATILTADKMNEHNDFDAPDRIAVKDYNGISLSGGKLSITIPKKSVIAITLKK